MAQTFQLTDGAESVCNQRPYEVAIEACDGYYGAGKCREREYFWVFTFDVQEFAGPVGCAQCAKLCRTDDFGW